MQSRKIYPSVPPAETSRAKASTPADAKVASGSGKASAIRAAAAAATPRHHAAMEPLEGRALLSAVLFSDGVLTLAGDDTRANIIRVDYHGGKNVTAIANGVYRSVPRSQVGSIRITGGSGIDRIRISKSLRVPTLIQTGAGNDLVIGGAGPDVVYGGDGNDMISGRGGKDRLIGGAGYDTLTGTRGVDIMFQGDPTPAPADPAPADPAPLPPLPPLPLPPLPEAPPPVPEAPPPVQVTAFGAKGDGVTDDSRAIQAAIDAAPAGATVNFFPARYRLTRGLMVTKQLTLIGNGSTLILDNPDVIRMRQISVVSPLSTTSNVWKQPVAAGQDTFSVSIPQSELNAGDMVFIELGTDPYDPYMPNFSSIVKVIENTGSSVMIDRQIPYGIEPGTLHNRMRRVLNFVEGAGIKGFQFDHTAGTVPDSAVWVQGARNVQVENISGRSPILAVVIESQDVTLRNLSADVTYSHQQAGRLLSLWQTDRIQMFDARVRAEMDAPVVFLESWSRDTTIDGLQIDWDVPSASQGNVIHWGAGSYGIFADNVTVRNTAPIQVVGTGDTPADYRIGALEVTGPVSLLRVDLVDTLVTPTRTYSQIKKVQREIALVPNSDNMTTILESGLIRGLAMTISSKTGVRSVLLVDPLDRGSNLTSQLKAGQSVDIDKVGFAGDTFWLNTLDGSAKRLFVYTDADLPPGAKITLTMEYFE